MPLKLISIIIVFFACSLTQAHEFWIQPDHLTGKSNELFTIRLMHGERFAGNIVMRNNSQIKRYEFLSESNESTSIKGRDRGQDSYLRPQESGVVVYESEHYTNNLEAERFNAYLVEEGLEHIIELRSELNESNTIGRESYSRCAKSILNLDTDQLSADQIDHPVGLPLEIILESINPEDPKQNSESKAVSALIQYQGQPIEDLRIVVARKSDPSNLLVLRTDHSGKIEFIADKADEWMITTIFIHRAEKIESAEWESFWASTVFST